MSINVSVHIYGQDHTPLIAANGIKDGRVQSCDICGFESSSVVPVNQDARTGEDMVMCDICYDQHHIDQVEEDSKIIYLPNIGNATFAHLVRAISTALRDDNLHSHAQELFEWLMSHSEYPSVTFGSDSPPDYADALRNIPPIKIDSKTDLATQHLFCVSKTAIFTRYEPSHSPCEEWSDLINQASKSL